jgi:hypothetical protein
LKTAESGIILIEYTMDPQKTNTTTETKVVVQKTRPVWKLKLALGFLTFLVIILLAGAGIAGVKGYFYYRDKKSEVAQLNSDIEKLKSQQNLNIVDLQKQLDDTRQENQDLRNTNLKLTGDLASANNKIAQLTPKDIRDVKYETLVTINKTVGDTWINPTYADLNGDGKSDGVYAYRQGGAGSYLNVYAYSYIDNNLTQILKAEQYPKGEVSVQPDMVLEIKYQTGAPDKP